MSHELRRLAASAFSTPHLITQEALSPILEYLSSRNHGVSPVFAVVSESKKAPKQMEKIGGIGEILVDGALTAKPIKAECAPEGVSYVSILNEARQLIKMGVDTIVMTHSSPGGEAMHAFSCAASLRSMCDEAGVELISYVDTYSASASYLIACVADLVIMHPEAKVGSIGCVCAIADTSKALDMAGVKIHYIASTPGKTPFQSDGSFSDKFLKEMQTDVTRLGDKFSEHVQAHTGISLEDIAEMDAKMFHSDEALNMGLANMVMDHTQFANWLAEKKDKKNA
jgi:ClpP class serine protease